jgi:hypothetical protein
MATRKRSRGRPRRKPRTGPGRPPIFHHRVQVTFQLEREEADAVTRLARKAQVPLSHYLRELVRGHLKRKPRSR